MKHVLSRSDPQALTLQKVDAGYGFDSFLAPATKGLGYQGDEDNPSVPNVQPSSSPPQLAGACLVVLASPASVCCCKLDITITSRAADMPLFQLGR